jgi:hypothetical protein
MLERCAVWGQLVLFSTFKSICFSPSPAPPAQALLERAAAAFPGPAARSRPFGSAYCASTVNQWNHSTVMMSQYAGRSAGGIGLWPWIIRKV